MTVGLALLHFLVIAFLAQVPAPTAPASDVYAIYSGLIAKTAVVRTGIGNVPTDDETYLIEATTVTSRSGFGGPGRGRSLEPPESCAQVPAGEAAGLGEILANYNQRKNVSVSLARQFTFAKPYLLLTTNEVERFLKDALEATPQIRVRDVAPPVNRNPLYQKSKRVFRLGEVYFNRDRTLALVYFSVYTTSLDGSGGWRALRKTGNGQWEENKSWACSAWGAIR